ncbi:hypothetical protein M419DRAFT_82390, partial [Trichoderma reesei RUT C-30]
EPPVTKAAEKAPKTCSTTHLGALPCLASPSLPYAIPPLSLCFPRNNPHSCHRPSSPAPCVLSIINIIIIIINIIIVIIIIVIFISSPNSIMPPSPHHLDNKPAKNAQTPSPCELPPPLF